jgi:hypothetical protein
MAHYLATAALTSFIAHLVTVIPLELRLLTGSGIICLSVSASRPTDRNVAGIYNAAIGCRAPTGAAPASKGIAILFSGFFLL